MTHFEYSYTFLKLQKQCIMVRQLHACPALIVEQKLENMRVNTKNVDMSCTCLCDSNGVQFFHVRVTLFKSAL